MLVSCHRCPGPPAVQRAAATLLRYRSTPSWRHAFGEPAHLWHCPEHVDCPDCEPASRTWQPETGTFSPVQGERTDSLARPATKP